MRSLDNIRVILVETGDSLNIGQVARAMMNLGFQNLHLVAPSGYRRDVAAVTACQAEPLLDKIPVHETLAEAIADCEEVVAFSMSKGRAQANFVTLPEWPAERGRRTALVFGPEDSGLRQEHFQYCRWIVSIPSAAECPSFNLAQSVLLVLYELTRRFPKTAAASASAGDAPTGNDFVQLDRLLDNVMTSTGFVRPGSPAPVPALVRNLFHRIPLNRHEMGVLLGLFGKIDTNLRRSRGTEERSQ